MWKPSSSILEVHLGGAVEGLLRRRYERACRKNGQFVLLVAVLEEGKLPKVSPPQVAETAQAGRRRLDPGLLLWRRSRHELLMEREGVDIGEGPSKANDDLPTLVLPVCANVPFQPGL